jgi:hypothetical protein
LSRPVLRTAFAATLLAGLFGLATPAGAADTPFSQRFAQTMRGSIEAVGNQLFVAGESGRRRYSLKLGKKGKKTPLVTGAGEPTVKLAAAA